MANLLQRNREGHVSLPDHRSVAGTFVRIGRIGSMLMPKKPRVVAMGEVRTEYPGSTAPLLTLEQHGKIAELARRTNLSEEEVCRRLVAAAQPSFDKVVDAALRLMAMQADSLENTSH